MKESDKKTDEDYEDEIKGVPLRRKRNVRLTTLNKIKANKNVKLLSSHNIMSITESESKNIDGVSLSGKVSKDSVSVESNHMRE